MRQHINEFHDLPEVQEARAADPIWVAEQAAKRDAASARFVQRRAEIDLPIIPKGRGERF